MVKAKKTTVKKRHNIYIYDDVYEIVKKQAAAQRRTVTKQIEFLITQAK